MCVSHVHGHDVGGQVLSEWADSILIFLNRLLGFESIPWVSLNWRLSREDTVLSSQRPLDYCLQSAFNRCCEGRNQSGSSAVRILLRESPRSHGLDGRILLECDLFKEIL